MSIMKGLLINNTQTNLDFNSLEDTGITDIISPQLLQSGYANAVNNLIPALITSLETTNLKLHLCPVPPFYFNGNYTDPTNTSFTRTMCNNAETVLSLFPEVKGYVLDDFFIPASVYVEKGDTSINCGEIKSQEQSLLDYGNLMKDSIKSVDPSILFSVLTLRGNGTGLCLPRACEFVDKVMPQTYTYGGWGRQYSTTEIIKQINSLVSTCPGKSVIPTLNAFVDLNSLVPRSGFELNKVIKRVLDLDVGGYVFYNYSYLPTNFKWYTSKIGERYGINKRFSVNNRTVRSVV